MDADRRRCAADEIRRRVAALGPWFHNIDLDGVQTAPDHFLGDYPGVKWRRFAHAIPADLTGKTVLDIGCNGGFYSIEMKRRGAERVLGIDFDDDYLRAGALRRRGASALDIEFRKLSVYDVGALGERFDVVLFMGVLYHLRHPLLALDLIHEHVARRPAGLPVDAARQPASRRRSRRTTRSGETDDLRPARLSEAALHRAPLCATTRPTGGCRTAPAPRRCCAAPASRSTAHPEEEVYRLPPRRARPHGARRGLSGATREQDAA